MKDRAAWKAPVGLCEIDANGGVVAVNELFLTWAASTRAGALGRSVPELLGLDSSEFEQVVGEAERGSARILVRHAPASGPDQIIVAAAPLEGGSCSIAIINAAQRHLYEDTIRQNEQNLRIEGLRLGVLLDAAVSFSDAANEKELSELLASAAMKALFADRASVHMRRADTFEHTGGHNPLESVWPAEAPPPGQRTLQAGRILVVENAEQSELFLPGLGMPDRLRSVNISAILVSPITDHGRPLGTLSCYFATERTFDSQAQALIAGLAQQAATVFARLELESVQRRAAQLDVITGLPNRRLFEMQLERSGRWTSHNSAVVFIDLDRFKQVNDERGHATGDQILAEVARRLLSIHRGEDTVARYGGDEFIAHFETTTEDTAATIAERICQTLALPYPQLPDHLQITASVGVATKTTSSPSSIDILIRQADQAMYRAKQAGGNQVAIF